MAGKNARKRAQRQAETRSLVSGMTGNGGPANVRHNGSGDRARPYRVIGTTASTYSTRVAGNTSRIWRDER